MSERRTQVEASRSARLVVNALRESGHQVLPSSELRPSPGDKGNGRRDIGQGLEELGARSAPGTTKPWARLASAKRRPKRRQASEDAERPPRPEEDGDEGYPSPARAHARDVGPDARGESSAREARRRARDEVGGEAVARPLDARRLGDLVALAGRPQPQPEDAPREDEERARGSRGRGRGAMSPCARADRRAPARTPFVP